MHTKGPWKSVQDGEFVVRIKPGGNYDTICQTYGNMSPENPDDRIDWKANAQAISALPDLLETGESLAEVAEVIVKTMKFAGLFDSDVEHLETEMVRMFDIIQKAEGGEKP